VTKRLHNQPSQAQNGKLLAPRALRRSIRGGETEDADVPQSNRFEALLLLLMSLISIAADLLRAV
jgi:hypothetical protein